MTWGWKTPTGLSGDTLAFTLSTDHNFILWSLSFLTKTVFRTSLKASTCGWRRIYLSLLRIHYPVLCYPSALVIRSHIEDVYMGVRRLFSMGGQNFPGGAGGRGQKHTICLKTCYFHSKKSKNILFWPSKGGGRVPPLALPCGRPWMYNKTLVYV